jgi:hypothetical protein
MAAAAAAADGMHVPNYRRRLDDINQASTRRDLLCREEALASLRHQQQHADICILHMQGVGGEWVMADNIILINGEHRNGMVNALSRTRVGATHGQVRAHGAGSSNPVALSISNSTQVHCFRSS